MAFPAELLTAGIWPETNAGGWTKGVAFSAHLADEVGIVKGKAISVPAISGVTLPIPQDRPKGTGKTVASHIDSNTIGRVGKAFATSKVVPGSTILTHILTIVVETVILP